MGERFRIFLYYCGDFPVLFVMCNDQLLYNPSSKIIVFREYLRRNHPEDANIYIQFLGPSPFWADFFIRAIEDGENTPIISIQEIPGYDNVDVNVPRSYFSEEDLLDEVMFDSVLESISRELGLYYRIVAFQGDYFEKENNIARNVDDLSEKLFQRRTFDFYNDLKIIKENSINSLLLDLEMLERLSFFRKEMRQLEQAWGLYYFHNYMNREIEEFKRARLQIIMKILKEMESYAQTTIFGRQSILAATFGAVVGALLTVLFAL